MQLLGNGKVNRFPRLTAFVTASADSFAHTILGMRINRPYSAQDHNHRDWQTDEMSMKAHRRNKVIVIGLVLFSIYISSYLVLSRRGFLQADQWNMKGFYFITPSSHTAWQVNRCLVIIFNPVIAIDKMLGTGRPVGSEPIYHLSVGGQDNLPGRVG